MNPRAASLRPSAFQAATFGLSVNAPCFWRKRQDLNLRAPFRGSRFRDGRNEPLCHVSSLFGGRYRDRTCEPVSQPRFSKPLHCRSANLPCLSRLVHHAGPTRKTSIGPLPMGWRLCLYGVPAGTRTPIHGFGDRHPAIGRLAQNGELPGSRTPYAVRRLIYSQVQSPVLLATQTNWSG